MRKHITFFTMTLIFLLKINAQPIKPTLFGQNAWFINTTAPVVNNTSLCNYTLISIDLPGHGKSFTLPLS